MKRRKYYCRRHKRNHWVDSPTGRACAARAVAARSAQRSAKQSAKQSAKRQARARRTPNVSVLPSRSVSRSGSTASGPIAAAQRREASRRRAVDTLFTQAPACEADIAGILLDPSSGYAHLADRLLDAMPWYRGHNRGHWLCRRLDEAARGLSPGTYLRRVGDVVAQELVRRGLPRFAAILIGEAMVSAGGRLVGSLGTDQLIAALRGLTLLVCPNFERCPTQQSVCTHFLEPGVEDALRSAFAR